jgi:hypothetical protein
LLAYFRLGDHWQDNEKMTQAADQPASLPNADTSREGCTIASIEMLDAIELEALMGQLAREACRPSHVPLQRLRLWITARWQRS